MRRSSSTSSVTSHPSSPCFRPSTPSIGRPVSWASCCAARRAASTDPSFPFVDFDRDAAISLHLQPCEELVLAALELVEANLAAVVGRLEPGELGPHLRRLV